MQNFIESVSTGNATLTITEKLKNILNETKASLKGIVVEGLWDKYFHC